MARSSADNDSVKKNGGSGPKSQKSQKSPKSPKSPKSSGSGGSNLVVKESNSFARAVPDPAAKTVLEERIIALTIADIKTSDTDFFEGVIPVKNVFGYDGLSGSELRMLHQSIAQLASKTYKVMEGSTVYAVYAVFSYIKHERNSGRISYKLNPELKQHLLQLRGGFTKRYLPDFMALSTVRSQQLFKELNSWKGVEQGYVDIPIERLHLITNATETHRSNFKEFRKHVLIPAEREINEKTMLSFTWKAIRPNGHNVSSVRFFFSDQLTELDILGGSGAGPHPASSADGFSDADIEKYQRLSNQCYERSFVFGKGTCRPNKGKKCTYCKTRGRMYARGLIAQASAGAEDTGVIDITAGDAAAAAKQQQKPAEQRELFDDPISEIIIAAGSAIDERQTGKKD